MSSSNTQPYVDAYARAMEQKLEANRHKGDRNGWVHDSPHDLFFRAFEEIVELGQAVREGLSPQEVLLEAADVGNMAMMVADAYATQAHSMRFGIVDTVSSGEVTKVAPEPTKDAELIRRLQSVVHSLEKISEEAHAHGNPALEATWEDMLSVRLLGLAGKVRRAVARYEGEEV